MPFVQRVVQPVNIAQVVDNGTTSVSGKTILTKNQTISSKCSNNNCINKQDQEQTQQSNSSPKDEHKTIENGICESRTTDIKATVKDIETVQKELQQNSEQTTEATTTPTTTKAIIHSTNLNINSSTLEVNQTNGFGSSFTYATDTEEDLTLTNFRITTPTSPIPTAQLPIKKLKQHVEFLSSAPSPSRNQSRSADSRPSASSRSQIHQRRRTASAPQSPTAAKVVAGYEFDSISNITLSNALRQLASLVLLASDIFDDLQKELQNIGDRSLIVQKKIIDVEHKVCAYDPKTVTVPESDLLTFAQRKVHYESKKVFENELFIKDTRPYSVRHLYEEAGKPTPPRSLTALFGSPHLPSNINGLDANVDLADTGVFNGHAAGSDDCICTPVFGRANRTMRTRIDAEIEIRLPAAIEDLRKWTSTEALGDVTVTPDCMHHVDTSISTSIIIGDNGILTPALSPSVLSADAVDALYSINASNLNDNIPIPNDINKDVPLNHRLPSPEEQLKIIALRYPAEIISVDTSGKRFQRMCMARKSTTGCYSSQMPENNNLNDDVHTVSRRSRSRKSRGKRRNTIAGIDQKEIQDAANGDSAMPSGENINPLASSNTSGTNITEDSRRSSSNNTNDKNKKFGRSKSSDILKKDSVALPYDKGKSTLTRLNSLKQWGRNRFKFMQRNDQPLEGILDTSGSSEQSANTDKNEQMNHGNGAKSSSALSSPLVGGAVTKKRVRDIDDECVVHDLVKQKSECRFSHERKPSYSSSEKSMSVSSSGHLRGKLHLATCGANVKLRDTSTLNRQRRNGILANGLSGKDEQPHSSSGNWSASSESGRASIGSEITIQPKSSASNTSLNVSSFHPGSGPPSSMLSRRRFMNTSASSSVTSEGTATPDLQVVDGSYPNHMDDETGSAYSCDTEGYYTSFHMDSGLRTLKEEEPPSTPLQASQNLHTSSSYSFGSQSNQTVLNAENEYELFGKGSTSTTTSSAGTVCTTLMVNGEQSSLTSQGPEVPERISSLGKLSKSNHSNSASTSTLERSYSSSTIGSTLERTGTIKRNVNAADLKISNNDDDDDEDEDEDNDDDDDEQNKNGENHEMENIRDRERTLSIATPESQDTEYEFEQKIRKRAAQPLPSNIMGSEMDCSESSDLEGVERIERIKQKTAINASRIPSMCIVTPTTSDDETNTTKAAGKATTSNDENHGKEYFDPNRTLTNESSPPTTKAAAKAEASSLKAQNVEDANNIYSSIVDSNEQHDAGEENKKDFKDFNLNVVKKSPPFNNMLEKLKVVLPNIRKSANKNLFNKNMNVNDDALYDPDGEYVYISDISNNNRNNQLHTPKVVGSSSLGIYYSNDIIHRKKQENIDPKFYQHPQQKHSQRNHLKEEQTEIKEYVSLNELPLHLRRLDTQKEKRKVMGIATNNDESNKTHFTTNESEAEKLYSADSSESANSVQPAYVESSTIPMYAEINELREEKFLYEPLSEQKGTTRVCLNAHGKIIYDSDSLKRRKGAHTTFVPGPFVKETESALPVPTNQIKELSSSLFNGGNNNASSDYATTKAAKLLLLNGGIAATRKIANVRPILAKSPLSSLTRSNTPLNSTSTKEQQSRMSSLYVEQQQQQQKIQNLHNNSYQETKQYIANQTNPFFQNNLSMMPSPSTKSTSSTGSTISSTPSTLTSSSSHSSQSASSREETGYQPFYRAIGSDPCQNPPQKSSEPTGVYETVDESFKQEEIPSSFQRNNQVYWTLQNRKQQRLVVNNVSSSRDDLYATPIRRSERIPRATATAAAGKDQIEPQANNNISPIVPRNRNGAFLTSTPTRDGIDLENLKASLLRPTSQQPNDTPERLNTCADRIGQSKTSLMDFKKLLLAKSAKSSPIQRKVSAVELLKKNNSASLTSSIPTPPINTVVSVIPTQAIPSAADQSKGTASLKTLNSSMKLLDLSGSPKTFANRRMLRQGQFGSPSKSLSPKIKPSPSLTWRSNSVQRTDIMSSTIVEATNSEEEKSNNSGSGASNSSRASSVISDTIETNYDIKQNFFIQSDENNFMRSEQKSNFNRTANSSNSSLNSINSSQSANKFVNTVPVGTATATAKNFLIDSNTFTATSHHSPRNSTAAMPALETAL